MRFNFNIEDEIDNVQFNKHKLTIPSGIDDFNDLVIPIVDKLKNFEELTDFELKFFNANYEIFKPYQIKINNKDELIDYILHALEINLHANLNLLDVSNVHSMRGLFDASKLQFYEFNFNGDISHWDVSNVTDMSYMFAESTFNGDISNWNVSNVINMHEMFSGSQFNQDISKWNTSKVKDMSSMFADSIFDGDISKWNVSNVKDMSEMFKNSNFNHDISEWDVSNVKVMHEMFSDSLFNLDISRWNINYEYGDMFFNCTSIDPQNMPKTYDKTKIYKLN